MKVIYWLSTIKMTGFAETNNSIIVDTSPIFKRFKGQPIHNLRKWLQKQKGYKEANLE